MPYRQFSHLFEKFLKDTRWPEPNLQAALRMDVALQFFHRYLSGWINLPVNANDPGYRAHGANPFALKDIWRVTNLTSAMQAIDFNRPLREIVLPHGTRVMRYGKPGEIPGPFARGLWFTEEGQPASMLALPPDQTVPVCYEVREPAPALESTAGDMLVDWGMNPEIEPTLGVDYHYRSGGSIQYTIPNARRYLHPLSQ